VVLMPGWGGVGDVAAVRDAQAVMFANQGYVALNIGFHQTSDVPAGPLAQWYSDLAESAKAALDTLCAQAYADCSAVVLTGESYGGTQTHPVVRYLRALGTYDGSGAGNAGRKVVGLLGQDSGYTYYYAPPADADATAYSIAMIQNLGDLEFPVDSCAFGNCGARNRADFHQSAAGSQYVLSYCPAGGSHGSR
jgi:dienelactone hydrolase